MESMRREPWDVFGQELERFRDALRRSRAVNVNTNALRLNAKTIVQQYFREARPEFVELGVDESALADLDSEMQSLLRLSNGRNAKRTYLSVIRQAQDLQNELAAERELLVGQRAHASGGFVVSETERRILEVLEHLAPGAALSYRQALRDLSATDRVSYRGTANDLREALRETVDRLAPDEKVKATPGFKLEAGQTKPTQKQKVRHILRSRGLGKTARSTPEDAAGLVDERTASVARASYERSSVAAHVSSTKGEVLQLKMYVDSVLAELLEIH